MKNSWETVLGKSKLDLSLHQETNWRVKHFWHEALNVNFVFGSFHAVGKYKKKHDNGANMEAFLNITKICGEQKWYLSNILQKQICKQKTELEWYPNQYVCILTLYFILGLFAKNFKILSIRVGILLQWKWFHTRTLDQFVFAIT